MFCISEEFPPGMKVFQIPLSWFRNVARFLNNFCPGTGINMTSPRSPGADAPVCISIDEKFLDSKIKGHLADTGGFEAGGGIRIGDGIISIDSDNLGKGTGADATATDASAGTAADESTTTYGGQTYADSFGALGQDTWGADGGAPLSVDIVTRIVQGGTNLGTASALYTRTFTFSPNGRLLAVSAENHLYRIRRT